MKRTTLTNYSAYRLIALFIRDNGLKNFTVKNIKAYEPELINYISSYLGGFKHIRGCVINNSLNLTQYLAIPKDEALEPMELVNEQVTGDLEEVLNEIFEEDACVEQEQEEENIEEIPVFVNSKELETSMNEIQITEQVHIGLNNVFPYLQQVIANQNALIDKLESMVSIATADKRIKDFEGFCIDGMRNQCVTNVRKIAAIKYKPNDDAHASINISKAWGFVYNGFAKEIGFELDKAHIIEFDNENANKIAAGKKPMKELSALPKIDVIEKYGYLSDFYLYVREKLEETKQKSKVA